MSCVVNDIVGAEKNPICIFYNMFERSAGKPAAGHSRRCAGGTRSRYKDPVLKSTRLFYLFFSLSLEFEVQFVYYMYIYFSRKRIALYL